MPESCFSISTATQYYCSAMKFVSVTSRYLIYTIKIAYKEKLKKKKSQTCIIGILFSLSEIMPRLEIFIWLWLEYIFVYSFHYIYIKNKLIEVFLLEENLYIIIL